MAQPDVGPNDIVIHLVNPYKCATCGTEFCTRSVFLEHLGEHIEKIKKESPCSQVISGVNMVEQRDDGITVTRDVLQINENQIFELQDPNLDYTQLAPLRDLEQAGILSLPKPRLPVTKTEPKDMAFEVRHVTVEPAKVELHPRSLLSGRAVSTPNKDLLTTISTTGIESQLTGQVASNGEANVLEMDTIVQQALFSDGQIKGDYSIMIETPAAALGESQTVSMDHKLLVASLGDDQGFSEDEKSIMGKKKKKPVCPTCFNEFSNQHALERHQVVHTGLKPHRCNVCFKQFNDVSSVRRHSLIHSRQHRCPICYRLYLRRTHLMMHMKHHGKKRYIQFGESLHEVTVKMSRNALGQIIQEFSLANFKEQEKDKSNTASTKVTGNNASSVNEENRDETKSESMENSCNKAVDGNGNSDDQTEDEKNAGNESREVPPNNEPNTGEHDIEETPLADDEGQLIVEDKDQQSLTKKKSVLYRCGHCKKMIYTRPTLSRHLIRHTNKRPFKCHSCSKSFGDKTDLVHHLRTHTRPVECETCKTSFSKNIYLKKHLQKGCPVMDNDSRFEVLPDMKCKCTICNKVFKSKANVIRHLRIHAFTERQKTNSDESTAISESVPEVLSEVKKVDGLSQNVEDHYQPLEGSVGFSCNVCGQELRFRSSIKTHVLMHLGIKPFSCNMCSKSFYSRHKLRKHVNNHTRPYKCPVCDKGFIRRYLMRDHYRKAHEEGGDEKLADISYSEDQKQIICDICGKTMACYQKSLMMYHVRMHKDVRPFDCNVCQKKFSSEIALKKHYLNHTKPYVCPVCQKGFSRRYILTAHFKKSCSKGAVLKAVEENKQEAILTDETKSEPQLVQTLQMKTLDSTSPQLVLEAAVAESDRTGYQPTIITEINTETGEEKYICEPCDKHFKLYDTLSRHIQTFARPTKCKYCGKVFEDKHLAIAHQRSCLGMEVAVKPQASNKKVNSAKGVQAKVQMLVKAIDKKINEYQSSDKELTDLASTENADTVITKAEVENVSSATSKAAKADGSSEQFICPECSRTFSTLRGLKIHASSHFRLFKCEECGKDFTHIEHLREHTLKHHSSSEADTSTHLVTATDPGLNIENQAMPESPTRAAAKQGHANEIKTPEERKMKRAKLDLSGGDDSDGEKMVELELKHQDIVEVTKRLMNSGTRGRPFSCQKCRRRFTEQSGLDGHMAQIHGVK